MRGLQDKNYVAAIISRFFISFHSPLPLSATSSNPFLMRPHDDDVEVENYFFDMKTVIIVGVVIFAVFSTPQLTFIKFILLFISFLFFQKMGHPRPLLIYFRSFQTIYRIKPADFRGIQTRIVGEQGKHADHLTSTTISSLSFSSR